MFKNMGDYYVGPFSSEDSMGRWLSERFGASLRSDGIPDWTKAKEEMSFDEWAEELIECEIINTTFELDSPN